MAAGRGFQSSKKVQHAFMAAVPAVSLGLLTNVKAASEKKLVNPRDLDVYTVPEEHPVTHVEHQPSRLQNEVSKVRKFVWRVSNRLSCYYGKSTALVTTTKRDLEVFYADAQKDPVLLIKPSVVSAAVVGGLLLPGKGRHKIQRLTLATILGLSAAAICYPKKAGKTTVKLYKKTVTLTNDFVSLFNQTNDTKAQGNVSIEGKKNQTSGDTETFSSAKENIEIVLSDEASPNIAPESVSASAVVALQEAEEKLDATGAAMGDVGHDATASVAEDVGNVVTSESTPSSVLNTDEASDGTAEELPKTSAETTPDNTRPAEDFGQSDPEDKDMYTTR